MFKLTQSPSYWWPVKLLVVEGDGSVAEADIEVLFKRLDLDQEAELQQRTVDARLTDPQFAREIMLGMRGVADEHGTELPWSEQARDALLRQPGAASAIVGEFFASRAQAHLGNLKRSRDAGSAATPASATATTPTRH